MKTNSKVFSVQPSPFNPIKFELGVILVLAVLTWLLVHSITDDPLSQVFCLVIFSLAASSWVVIRVRLLSQKMRNHGASDN